MTTLITPTGNLDENEENCSAEYERGYVYITKHRYVNVDVV